MPRICLSYRRSDSAAIVGRIYDWLVDRFGAESVFMDLSDIPYGADFRKHIETVLRDADLLLAAVGPNWLGKRADGGARIHDKEDPVRAEIQAALQQRVVVIPVLVDGGTMPGADELPRKIRAFASRNAVTVDSGLDFPVHMGRLIASINQALGLHQEDASVQVHERKPRLNPPTLDFPAPPAVQLAKRASSRLLYYFAVPAVLLLFSHYLIVMKWDLDAAYLRPVAIVIPLTCGFLSFKELRLGISAATLLGLSVALAAIAGMMTVVGLIDRHAILPQSEAGWQEAFEFTATITLATTAGNWLGRLIDPSKPQKSRRSSAP